MDNFLLCLNAILPLLLLMLLGYGLRRSGMISHEGFSAMDTGLQRQPYSSHAAGADAL